MGHPARASGSQSCHAEGPRVRPCTPADLGVSALAQEHPRTDADFIGQPPRVAKTVEADTSARTPPATSRLGNGASIGLPPVACRAPADLFPSLEIGRSRWRGLAILSGSVRPPIITKTISPLTDRPRCFTLQSRKRPVTSRRRGHRPMELRDALTQISEIRHQMARTEVFRGYRAVPVAFSGLLAVSAAVAQGVALRDPAQQMNAVPRPLDRHGGRQRGGGGDRDGDPVAGRRGRRCGGRSPGWPSSSSCRAWRPGRCSRWSWSGRRRSALWMLPGLWQILFSLGVFASCRLLPRATFFVALFYLIAGPVDPGGRPGRRGVLALGDGPAVRRRAVLRGGCPLPHLGVSR